MGQKKKELEEKKEKPLERWTIKELREEALKVPDIQGVHGMNKEEILITLRKHKGISEPEPTKKGGSVREIKKKINELREIKEQERESGAARTRLDILRKKISRLKKQTQRQA